MEKDGYLYLTLVVEWIWIDNDLLFDLNLHIPIEIVSRLLGLIRWRDDLSLCITAY